MQQHLNDWYVQYQAAIANAQRLKRAYEDSPTPLLKHLTRYANGIVEKYERRRK